MSSYRTTGHPVGLAALALLVVLTAAAPASASLVDPILVPGNPGCSDLGYDFGFKPQPEPPPSGTYTFPAPDGVNELTLTSDGIVFDWSSTLALDAVIVKGGPNANVYVYDPEATADTGLHSPVNPSNGQFYAISHIEVCYDYEVTVSKDAETSLTRTYTWTIDKSVAPDTWHLFVGESGTSTYGVMVTRSETDSDWAVEGTITIDNATPFDAVIESVADVISTGIAAPVDCGVTFPYLLAAGDTLECSYSSPLPDAADRLNTATVATSGLVGGGEATADVSFAGATITEVGFPDVNVVDTNGPSWPASGDDGWTYDQTFPCSTDTSLYVDGYYMYTHDNTATIVQTGQSDSETVTVHCYAPAVTKTADTSFDRTWEWTIEKTADQSELTLSPGQQFLVNYSVAVSTSSSDGDWEVSGTITVANPHPTAAMTVGLADVVSPDLAATLDCGGTLVVPAASSATCGYSASLPDGSPRTNTATATLNGVGFSGSADVLFGDPDQVFDECVDVTDSNLDPPDLGTVCTWQAPQTFEYSLYVGPYEEPDECGLQQVVNTAAFVANDTGASDDDTWTIDVTVVCDEGCTLTPGYWKTHSIHGPAPYDDTWALVGEDTVFFLSGQSFYEVLWTPPKGGNAYYILAHAYIASVLNLLNGASAPPEVLSTLDGATVLFETYTPDEIGALKGKPADVALRESFLSKAALLDWYNNGIVGPGHCSEEAP